MPDFIALRGRSLRQAPRSPRRRRRRPPRSSRSTAPSRRARRGAVRRRGRRPPPLYSGIAQLDHSAPLPPLDDGQPDWAGAALAGRWGLGALAGRLEEGAAHRNREQRGDAALHPTGPHPESWSGSGCCSSRSRAGTSPDRHDRGGRAPLSRRRVRRADPRDRRPDVARSRHGRFGDELRGRAAVRRSRAGGGGARSLRDQPAARPSRASRACDGLLPVRQRGDRGPATRRPAWHRAGGDRRLGRPSRKRDGGDLLGRPDGVLRLAAPVAVLSGTGGPNDQNETTLNVPLPAGSGTRYADAFSTRSSPPSAASIPSWSSSRRASTRTSRTPSR